MNERASDPFDAFANRAAFGYWRPIQRRFADLDPLKHINNTAISSYFEAARMALIEEISRYQDDRGWVLAEITIRYMRELYLAVPMLDVGTGAARIGRTSVVLMGGLFEADTTVALARQVVVQVDLRSRKPAAFNEQQRTFFEKLLPGR